MPVMIPVTEEHGVIWINASHILSLIQGDKKTVITCDGPKYPIEVKETMEEIIDRIQCCMEGKNFKIKGD